MKSAIFCYSSQHKMRVSMCYISGALVEAAVGFVEANGCYVGYDLQSPRNH